MKRTIFDTVSLPKPKRSKFDLSHERKLTMPFGALIPTLVMETLPGDNFQFSANILARFQSLLTPPMHRVNIFTHYYYVPNHILSRQWKRFISYQGARPVQSTFQSELPFFTIGNARGTTVNGDNPLRDGSLLDYLGFPTAPNDVTISNNIDNLRINALLPLAYQKIWDDNYRDPNFTQPLFSEDSTTAVDPNGTQFLDSINGSISAQTIPNPEQSSPLITITALEALLTLRWRAWEKDYLTSAQPFAQLGSNDVRVPINIPTGSLGNTPAVGTPIPSADRRIGNTGGIQYPGQANNPTDGGSFTVTALRVATSLKRWLENSYRGGVRYGEQLWQHWFVNSDDNTLYKSHYIGGLAQPMVLSEVVTTAPATPTQTTVVGASLLGHGISYANTNQMRYKCKDHGFIIGITSVLPRTSYLYSMPRAFMRTEPLDFAFPEFAQLGEQPVLGAEVMFKLPTTVNSTRATNYTNVNPSTVQQGLVNRFPMGYQSPTSYLGFDLQNDSAEGNTQWGFQGRYAEYKYMPDTVHGLFRNTQSIWHFGRMLSPGVALNNAFVTSNPRMDVFAVLPNNGTGPNQYSQHPINLQVYNKVSVIRSLPYYNNPTIW